MGAVTRDGRESASTDSPCRPRAYARSRLSLIIRLSCMNAYRPLSCNSRYVSCFDLYYMAHVHISMVPKSYFPGCMCFKSLWLCWGARAEEWILLPPGSVHQPYKGVSCRRERKSIRNYAHSCCELTNRNTHFEFFDLLLQYPLLVVRASIPTRSGPFQLKLFKTSESIADD